MPIKLTMSEVVLIFKNKGLELIDTEYKNTKTKLKCKDEEGYLYYLSVDGVKDKRTRKFDIVGFKNPYSVQNIQQYIYNNGYSSKVVSTEYKGINSKMDIICECGNHFKVNWTHIRETHKFCCNKCGYEYITKTQRTPTEYLEKEISKYGYHLLKNVEQKSKSLKVVDENGEVYHTTIYVFRNGGLPSLGSSLELRTEKYLQSKDIKYIKEKTFKECKNIGFLRFDFYLPTYNVCIECDGKQHYTPINFFGGEKGFKILKINDNIKEEYCKNNKIKLIRIPYWEFKDDKFEERINKILE